MSNFPAGSKVIITNADRGETAYKNGEIYTVDYPEDPGVNVTVGDQTRYLASYEFEAYTEPFKVGDRVRVLTDSDLPYLEKGDVGTVMEIGSDVRIQQDAPFTCGDGAWWVAANNAQIEEPLDATPRTIAFEDIQQGDTIRAEYTQNGIKHTREGVAHETFGSTNAYWGSDEGGLVADTAWNATYTLLERPKPNPFAEAKVGSIATYGEEGIKYLKTGDDAWAPISRKGTLSDYRNSDESMTNCGDLIQVTHNA